MDTVNLSLNKIPMMVTLRKTLVVHFHIFLTKCFIVPQQNSTVYYR